MINFYMTPGSCSTGIHILLEELELIFSAHIVNLLAGDQYQSTFIAMNPKSTIPVLVLDDGTVLNSFQGIAWWLALAYPKAALLPDNAIEQAKLLDFMAYVINHIHGNGFTRIFTPQLYAKEHELTEPQILSIRQQGEEIVKKGFELVANSLGDDGYYLGKTFSIADAALFYVEFWADKIQLVIPEKCTHHYNHLKERRAVRQVLAEEGYRY